MAAKNPNPANITDQVWAIWTGFDVMEPTAVLSGILARKPGYHNLRSALPADDYSVGDVASDRQGPGDKAAAIDLSMSAAAMRLYTRRLDVAARARDGRLFIAGEPFLREFIGTLDSKSVYCWVFTGGRALGVGADAGPDPGRDTSHLSHLHNSIIRKFLAHPELASRLLSVLSGESYEAWRARTIITSTGVTMQFSDKLPGRTSTPGRDVGNFVVDGSNQRDFWHLANQAVVVNPPEAGSPAQLVYAMARDWAAESARQRLRDEAILAAVQGQRSSADIIAQVDLRASQLAAAIGQMRSQIAAELAPMLMQAIGSQLTQVPQDVLAAAQETALRRVLGGLDEARP
jgi:hypothetical protein